MSNQISDISFLKDLKSLISLSLTSNNISKLSYNVFNNLKNIKKWDDVFNNNPITNPPLEILKQGKQAIKDWFDDDNILNHKNTIALLIGASEFPKDTEGNLKPIPNIEVNIQKLKKVLMDKNIVGIPEQNITVSFNESKADIEKRLFHLIDATQNSKYNLLIYYSGHGYPDFSAGNYNIYLATHSTNSRIIAQGAIKINDLANYIKGCNSKQKIIILDACYSGEIHLSGAMGEINSHMKVEMNKFEGSFVISSTSKDNFSLFTTHKSVEPTYFTGELINVLENGIINKGKYINTNDIFIQIKKNLLIKKLPEPQVSYHLDADKILLAKNTYFNEEGEEKINKIEEKIKFANKLIKNEHYKEASKILRLALRDAQELENNRRIIAKIENKIRDCKIIQEYKPYFEKKNKEQNKTKDLAVNVLELEKKDVKKYKNEIEYLKKELTKKEKELEKRNKKEETLKKHLANKEREIEDRNKKEDTLKKHLANKEREIEDRNKKEDTLKKHLANKESEIERKNKKEEILKKHLANKEKELIKAKNNSSSKNIFLNEIKLIKFDEKIQDTPLSVRLFQYFLVEATFSKKQFEKQIQRQANELKKTKSKYHQEQKIVILYFYDKKTRASENWFAMYEYNKSMNIDKFSYNDILMSNFNNGDNTYTISNLEDENKTEWQEQAENTIKTILEYAKWDYKNKTVTISLTQEHEKEEQFYSYDDLFWYLVTEAETEANGYMSFDRENRELAMDEFDAEGKVLIILCFYNKSSPSFY